MPKVVQPKRVPWRLVFLLFAWGTVFITTAWAAKQVQHFVLKDPHFELPARDAGITLQGVQYAPRSRVMQIFASDFGVSAFHVPLAERRRRLLAIDWIEDASVSRLWPNRLVVRVKERKAVAFVNLVGGRYSLIDAQGVLLSPPLHARFEFPVLSGITEEQTERQRGDRVQAMLALASELGPAMQQVSEVNAASVEDLRVTLQLDHRALELWMGDSKFAARYRTFMNHYPEIRRTSSQATVFDLRIDDRITAK